MFNKFITVLFTFVVLLLVFEGGILYGRIGKVDPQSTVSLTDMRSIITALEPYENSRWERASICVRSKARQSYQSQATVGIEFHPKEDTKLYGWGNSIEEAIDDLSNGSSIVKNVLVPLTKDGALKN